MRKGLRAALLSLLMTGFILPASARAPLRPPPESADPELDFSDLDVSFQNINKPLAATGTLSLAVALFVYVHRERARMELYRSRASETLAKKFLERGLELLKKQEVARGALNTLGISVTESGDNLRFDGPPLDLAGDVRKQLDEELERTVLETTARHAFLQHLESELMAELMGVRIEQIDLAQTEVNGIEHMLDQRIRTGRSGIRDAAVRSRLDALAAKLRSARSKQNSLQIGIEELSTERSARHAKIQELRTKLMADATRAAALRALGAKTFGEGLERATVLDQEVDDQFREKLSQALANGHNQEADIEALAMQYDELSAGATTGKARPEGATLLEVAVTAERKRQNLRNMRENLAADLNTTASFADSPAFNHAEAARQALGKATAGTILLSALKREEMLRLRVLEAQKEIAGKQDGRAAEIAANPDLLSNLERIADYSDKNYKTTFGTKYPQRATSEEKITFAKGVLEFFALGESAAYEAHTQQVQLRCLINEEESMLRRPRATSAIAKWGPERAALGILIKEYIKPAMADGVGPGTFMQMRAANLLSLRFVSPVPSGPDGSPPPTDPLADFRSANPAVVREKVAGAISQAHAQAQIALASLRSVSVDAQARRILLKKGGDNCRSLLVPETPNSLIIIPAETQ